jgi:hypothetical protein
VSGFSVDARLHALGTITNNAFPCCSMVKAGAKTLIT